MMAFAIGSFAGKAFADEPNEHDAYVGKDRLIGYYRVIVPSREFSKTFNRVDDPFVDAYQYFVFREDGRMDYLVSNRDIDLESGKDFEELFRVINRGSSSGIGYRFLDRGFIVLFDMADPERGSMWSVNEMPKDIRSPSGGIDLKKGDVLLSMDKKGNPVFRKQLRRLPLE